MFPSNCSILIGVSILFKEVSHIHIVHNMVVMQHIVYNFIFTTFYIENSIAFVCNVHFSLMHKHYITPIMAIYDQYASLYTCYITLHTTSMYKELTSTIALECCELQQF